MSARVNTGKGTAAEGWNAREKHADSVTRQYMENRRITMRDVEREPAIANEVAAVWNDAMREYREASNEGY